MGDEEFQRFLDNNDENNKGERKLPFFLMVTVREKLNSINELYTTSLKYYVQIPDNDPMKKQIRDYVQTLMDNSENGIEQLNILMGTEIDIDNGDVEDEENGDERGISENPDR